MNMCSYNNRCKNCFNSNSNFSDSSCASNSKLCGNENSNPEFFESGCCCNPKELSSLLKIVVEESRLTLLCLLCSGDYCVCEMEAVLDMSQSLISHHLADLRKIGLVEFEQDGQRKNYSLSELGKNILQCLEFIRLALDES